MWCDSAGPAAPRLPRRYEKARKLKEYIGSIRETYQRNWDSKDRAERQVGRGVRSTLGSSPALEVPAGAGAALRQTERAAFAGAVPGPGRWRSTWPAHEPRAGRQAPHRLRHPTPPPAHAVWCMHTHKTPLNSPSTRTTQSAHHRWPPPCTSSTNWRCVRGTRRTRTRPTQWAAAPLRRAQRAGGLGRGLGSSWGGGLAARLAGTGCWVGTIEAAACRCTAAARHSASASPFCPHPALARRWRMWSASSPTTSGLTSWARTRCATKTRSR